MASNDPSPIRFTIDSGLSTELIVDATTELDYDADVETTDHPVEQGANTTDHARAKPEVITATCIVTNIPVDSTDREVRDANNSDGSKARAQNGYAQQVYSRLVKMKNDRQLHTLSTVRGVYSNMIITKLSTPTRAQYGDGLMFKIAFKEIRIVTTGTAQLVAIKQPKTLKPTDKEHQAKKQGTTPGDGRRTALKTLTDTLGLTHSGSGVAP